MTNYSERHNFLRMNKLIRECIDNFDLDLSGLSVYTEAANGWYLYNAVLTALAGAEKVYAVAMDSEYSPGNNVRRMTEEAAEKWEVSSKIEVVSKSQMEIVGKCDIPKSDGMKFHRIKGIVILILVFDNSGMCGKYL